MKAQEQSVEVNGLTLSVKTWGNPQDKPILAIHGWQDNAATFDELAPRVPGFYWIVPDMPGHGLSDHRGTGADYHLWSYCTEVLLLAKAFNLNHFILLGHSMGGGIANLVAGLAPDRVSKLVLLDVLGVITTGSENTLEQMRKGLSQRVDKAPRKPGLYSTREKAIAARAKNGITLEAAALLGARGIANNESGFYWQHDQRLSRRSLLSMSEEQMASVISAVSCPVLVVGSQQAVFRQEVVEARKKLFKDVQVITLEGGHHQHLDGDVDRVAELVGNFLWD